MELTQNVTYRNGGDRVTDGWIIAICSSHSRVIRLGSPTHTRTVPTSIHHSKHIGKTCPLPLCSKWPKTRRSVIIAALECHDPQNCGGPGLIYGTHQLLVYAVNLLRDIKEIL
jgi:hypothetical protein